jgi:chaperonin cofactor prefoldin
MRKLVEMLHLLICGILRQINLGEYTMSNIADISVFENLQASANAMLGCSGMSTFQDACVENATFKEIRKPATPEDAKIIEKLKKDLESLEKEYSTKVPSIFKGIDANIAEQKTISAKMLKLKSELEQSEARLQTLKTQESKLYAQGDQTQAAIVGKSPAIRNKLDALGVQVVECAWDKPVSR